MSTEFPGEPLYTEGPMLCQACREGDHRFHQVNDEYTGYCNQDNAFNADCRCPWRKAAA